MATTDVDLRLPKTPQGVPDNLFSEFLRIYHALELLASFVTAVSTGVTDTLTSRISKVLATEVLPAFRVVTSTGKIADSANLAHVSKVAGITLEAIASGFRDAVVDFGTITNPGWAWTAGDVLYLNGTALSTAAPTTGFCQEIGIATSATTVIVLLGTPVLL